MIGFYHYWRWSLNQLLEGSFCCLHSTRTTSTISLNNPCLLDARTMDEADCCSQILPESEDVAGCLAQGKGDNQGDWRRELNEQENYLSGTSQEGRCMSSDQVEGDFSGRGLDNTCNVLRTSQRVGDGHDEWTSSSSHKEASSVFTPAPEKSQNENQFENVPCLNENPLKTDISNNLGKMPYLRVDDTQGSGSSTSGTDETDQGQVVPTLDLTRNHHTAYAPELSSSQYYSKHQEEGLSRPTHLVPGTTIKEQPGLTSGMTQAAVGHASNASMTRQQHPATAASCAINKTAVQGQTLANSKLPPASRSCVESEELTKRKMEESGEEDQTPAMMKKQKVSPTVNQSDVQYNQTILSMPRKYNVSGTGNYVFDAPSNCTFHLYQNQRGNQPQKQHALEWASLVTQPDSVSDATPVPALETVAKLIAQTTNWKTFARRLPMSECGNLEADIRALEECQGTTSDKTSAVLMRWWRERPQQADGAAMKTRLKDGLEACGLIRLARSLDKYL